MNCTPKVGHKTTFGVQFRINPNFNAFIFSLNYYLDNTRAKRTNSGSNVLLLFTES